MASEYNHPHPAPHLANLSDDDLKARIASSNKARQALDKEDQIVRDELERRRMQERHALGEKLVEHAQSLLVFSKHEYTTCSDDNIRALTMNGTCTRCFLHHVIKDGVVPEVVDKVELSIKVYDWEEGRKRGDRRR